MEPVTTATAVGHMAAVATAAEGMAVATAATTDIYTAPRRHRPPNPIRVVLNLAATWGQAKLPVRALRQMHTE